MVLRSNCGTLLRDELCIISRIVLCYIASSVSPPKRLPYPRLLHHCSLVPLYSVFNFMCHTLNNQHTPLVLRHHGAVEDVKFGASCLKRKRRKIRTFVNFHQPRTFKRPRNPKYLHISAPPLYITPIIFMALLCHGRLC